MIAGGRNRFARDRDLIGVWAVREIKARYRQSALDLGWSVLTPMLTLAGFGIVLTEAFGVDGDGVPYLSFAWCGLVVWTFVTGGVVNAGNSLLYSADLVRKVYFPREVVPVATIATSLLDLAVGLAALGVLMTVQGVALGPPVVAAPVVLIAVVVWTTGVSLLLAAATVFVRDLSHAVSVAIRVGIFVTPVMYPPSVVPPQWRWVLSVNPLAVFIEALRDALLRRTWPDWGLLGIHSLVGLIVLVGGFLFLVRVEGEMADVI